MGARTGTAAPITDATPPRYVALGDSYSSGEGAGNYLPAAPGRPEVCHRSRNAYSQLLARRLLGGVQHSSARDFLACSRDEVPDLKSRQLGALGTEVRVVTVGIGGNDLGWKNVLEACALNTPGRERCNDIIARAFAQRLTVVQGRLREAYAIIKRDAPNAKVIVVGYPAVFEDSFSSTICASTPGLSRAERADLRVAAERLNRAIGAIATSFGFRFVDPSAAFNNHRICGPGQDWIHGLTRGRGGEPVVSLTTFHPNASGQRGLADAIAAANPDVFR